MIVTVFRSRLNPDHVDEYKDKIAEMGDIARSLPGYISHKAFTAEDGERVSIIYFESWETHEVWAKHPEHLKAKAAGQDRFYLEYSIHVCESVRSHSFPR